MISSDLSRKLLLLIVLCCISVAAHSAQYGNKSSMKKGFFKHCESEELSATQRETLYALFKRYLVDSCKALHKKLTARNFQMIQDKGISDVTIFQYVYGLKKLTLDRNRITDISSFEGLDKIERLSLSFNQITDVRPLLKMKSLKYVTLLGNPIEKESEKCPLDTHVPMINEFCFDEQKFDQAFDSLAANESITSQDLEEIIGLVINFPGLEIFYHADSIPDRSPLQLHVDKLPASQSLALSKFGEPVSLQAAPTNLGLNCNIQVKDNHAVVSFKYPPEGVFGKFKLKHTGKEWRVVKSRVLE